MPSWVEFFNWWVLDNGTGERRLTPYKLTRADAKRAFPGAEPDIGSLEVRWVGHASYSPGSSRPGEPWF
jgi:hypothetical protein